MKYLILVSKIRSVTHNEIGAKFKECQPLLTGIHCVCHRLALAAAQTGSEVAYNIHNKFKPTLSQLF